MTDFDKVMERLLPHEGGSSTDRADPGNWTGGTPGSGLLRGTKYGIAANTYPDLDIKNLSWEHAKAIYFRDFWDKAECDKLPMVVAYQLLDAAINSGIQRATKWLQRAVGAVQDGSIGPATIARLQAADPNDIAFRFLGYRLQFMTDLSTWERYGKGWARRISANLLYAAEDN